MKNDLGINPDEWFENPLDSMPVANGTNKYASPEKMAELESNPDQKKKLLSGLGIKKKNQMKVMR